MYQYQEENDEFFTTPLVSWAARVFYLYLPDLTTIHLPPTPPASQRGSYRGGKLFCTFAPYTAHAHINVWRLFTGY